MDTNKNFFLKNFKQIIEHFKINDLILKKIIKCAKIFKESSIKKKKLFLLETEQVHQYLLMLQ